MSKGLKWAAGALLGLAGLPGQAMADTCPFSLPGVTVQCGRIDLPADHAHPEGRQRVSLFYARVPARSPTPEGTPVVLLSGGPGLAGSQTLKQAAALYAGIQETQELIFVDQRGTGYSTPSLLCPKVHPESVLYGSVSAREVRECLQPLTRAGYRTAWFDTLQSALDIIAMRKQLGIAQWNLFGTSYGTALAQEIMRRDSLATRAVVLNSPTTTWASQLDTATVTGVAAAWERIFLDCAAAPQCAAQAPAMRAHFLELMGRLQKGPLPATWTEPSGQIVQGRLTTGSLQTLMTMLAGSGEGSMLALSTYQYLYGVLTGITPENPQVIGSLYLPKSFWQLPTSTALGLNMSITCREVMPGLDLPALRRQARFAQPFVQADNLMKAYQEACPIWGAGQANRDLRTPVTVPVPTLLLTGNYDMAAPSHLAQSIAGALPDARLVNFDGVGHAVFEAVPCARQLVADFLRDGRTDVASACVVPSPATSFKLWKLE